MLNLLLSYSIPFYPQNFGVELVATWSDGKDSTAAVDVEVKDGWVYLIGTKDPTSTGGDYLWVLDAREPCSEVKLVAEDTFPDYGASDLVIVGQYLYAYSRIVDIIAVHVYSISDPSEPKYIRTVEVRRSGSKGIGSRAVVFSLSSGLYTIYDKYIYSLKRPDSPFVYSELPVYWATPIAFLPPKYLYAWITGGRDTVVIYDLSDPKKPIPIDTFATSPYSWSGTLWFDQDSTPYLLIGTWYLAKIFVYSLENPEEPVLVRTINAGSEMITAHGRRIYTAATYLAIIEDLDTIVGYYNFDGMVNEILWHDNLIYLANRIWSESDTPQYDLYIFHYVGDTPQTFNAWFSKGNLFLELPNPSEVRVSLYDLKGSLILKRELSLPWGESSVPLETPPSRGIYLALVERKGTNQRRVVKCYF